MYIIFGASSGVGYELSIRFALESNDLLLISSDKKDLIRLKKHLITMYKIKVDYIDIDLTKSISNKTIKVIMSKMLEFELKGILFPVGRVFRKDYIPQSYDNSLQIVNVNFLNIILIINTFVDHNKKLSIVGFGSISASRGRMINTLYSASKSALYNYFQSLTYQENIKVQFYNLGYLKTGQTYGKNTLIYKGCPKKLASIVYRNLTKKNYIATYPFIWVILEPLIKFIPKNIFKKIE